MTSMATPETVACCAENQTLHGQILDEARGLIRTPVAWLARLADPLLTPPWEVDRIDPAEVLAAITAGEYLHAGHTHAHDPWERTICRACDIARIAYLVEHGWPAGTADPHPVTVDLGVGDYWPDWPIIDGNHRLAAALVTGDPFIDVNAAGDWDRCLSVLVHGTDPMDLP